MPYPSDLTQEQFERIAPLLEQTRKKTKPRKHDLHDVINGLMYVVKSGCQWRMLPQEYPNYRSVHAYFRIWSEVPKGEVESTLDKVLKKIGRGRAYQKWKRTQDQYGYR